MACVNRWSLPPDAAEWLLLPRPLAADARWIDVRERVPGLTLLRLDTQGIAAHSELVQSTAVRAVWNQPHAANQLHSLLGDYFS